MARIERENSATPRWHRRRADTPMEEVRTESLKRYLVQAWQEMSDPNVESDFPTSIFARMTTESEEPVLRSDQINHIIIYTGAFNPPHEGHVRALADAFYSPGPRLNIVSAFVVPINDDGLRAKEDARQGPGPRSRQVMLTRDQRAELLTAHLRGTAGLEYLASKTKVWRFPELEPIPGYMRRLVDLAAADGFDVEFVSLKGSDHLWFDRPIKHPALIMCKKIIFSEIRRVNKAIWTPWGDPRPLMGGWGPWLEISSVDDYDGLRRSVWESTLKASAGSAVRLLWDRDEADEPNTSSSNIRKIILESAEDADIEDLVQKLRDAQAVCPEMLAEFLCEDAQ